MNFLMSFFGSAGNTLGLGSDASGLLNWLRLTLWMLSALWVGWLLGRIELAKFADSAPAELLSDLRRMSEHLPGMILACLVLLTYSVWMNSGLSRALLVVLMYSPLIAGYLLGCLVKRLNQRSPRRCA
jgi:hypothetical protein